MGETINQNENEKPRFILLGFFIFIIIATLSFTVWFLMSTESEDKYSYIIPEWVKANAGWWSEGEITDEEFSYSLQWLFDHGLVDVQKCTGRCL